MAAGHVRLLVLREPFIELLHVFAVLLHERLALRLSQHFAPQLGLFFFGQRRLRGLYRGVELFPVSGIGLGVLLNQFGLLLERCLVVALLFLGLVGALLPVA